MPGLIAFGRRWGIGSDDLVVPSLLLLLLHAAWIIISGLAFGLVKTRAWHLCSHAFYTFILGYLILLCINMISELMILLFSLRGSTMNARPRRMVPLLLYIRAALFVVEIGWLVFGVSQLVLYYDDCPDYATRKTVLAITICNWLVLLLIAVSLWISYDRAGRRWFHLAKMKDGVRDVDEADANYAEFKRDVSIAYQEAWSKRCRRLCCCLSKRDLNSESLTDVAHIFSSFFLELDWVPSDAIVGLMLIKRKQRTEIRKLISQNEVNDYLSGIAITETTPRFDLQKNELFNLFQDLLYFFDFCVASYGWPLYTLLECGNLCKLIPGLRCCCCSCSSRHQRAGMSALPGFEEEGDNCCQCNAAAIHKVLRQEHIEIVHASFSNLIKDAAFFVALDHDYRKIVVSIRGTMSLEDVITDLIAEPEKFPEEVSQGREWYAHKGILEAAQALKSHVKEIFAILPDEVIESYGLLFVGHSLGAGTAAVLAILLKNEYPSSECYAYAPPGGLLSEQCVNDTKSFITTVVYGKDLVPRIGLAQLESLRAKMMRVMKNTNQPKWCIIGGGLLCCCRRSSADQEVDDAIEEEQNDKLRLNPSNTSLPPSSSRPLYPPGRIVHIVRSPQNSTKGKSNEKNAFMAVETDNVEHYNELIISRTMATDHLPFNMKNAMEKTVEFASHRSDLKPAGRSSILTRRDELASEDPSKANRLSVLAPSDDLSWDCANSVEVRFRDSLRQARETRHMNGGHGTQPMRTTRIRPPPQTLALRSGYFDPYIGRAPLATPETLSETSSLSSLTTPAGSIHHRLSAVFSPLMEPITQSPRPQYVSNGAVATTSDSAIGSMAPCSDDSSPPLASTRMEARRGPPKPPRLFLEPQSADDPDGEFVLWCASADDNDSDVERELVTTPYKLTFENGSLGSTGEDEMALDNYQIHCPLNEDDCNQEEYDPHRPYSHGAIGYQPLRLLLPHENGISRMKRSAEMDLSAIPEQVSLTYADEQSP